MAIVISNAYKATLIDKERAFLNTCKIRLFSNNNPPLGTSVTGDFNPPTDAGYVATGDQFPVFTVATVVANQGQLLAPALTWTITHNAGDVTIWGYIVVDPANANAFVYGEIRGSAAVLTANGDTYTVIPKKVMDTL